ncbi:minor capsid protein [Mesorhizobium sp. Cs1299R1N3]|uniref:minor capsid protein n=1 Tax=Mesorhizobium sp. Cs1299R1N3 TaxID=3015173 RepID=UPI00301D6682
MPNAVAHNLLVQHRIGLERYGVAINKKILSRLNKVEADIVAKIGTMSALDATTAGPSPSVRRHLEDLLAQIQATTVEAMAVINSTIETDLGDLAVHEVEWAASTYKATLPFATNFVIPAPQLLKAVVTTRPLQGRLIKDWLAQYPGQIRQKVNDAVMTGIMEGEGIPEIVRRIRGTRALNYGDGILRGTKRGVEALTRTAVNHVSNAAHKTFLDDNADVFDRYQWVSVLDARTTPVCVARSGRVYANSPGSANPIPPAHINCRSTIAPIVIGQEVEPVNDYAKWLAGQPPEVQTDVLGPARRKLWIDGKIRLDKFVTDQGRPLTLEQLKTNDAAAWKRAFGTKAPYQAANDPGKPRGQTPPTPVQTTPKVRKPPAPSRTPTEIVESPAMRNARLDAEAKAYVVEQGKATNTEHLVMFDSDSGYQFARQTTGQKSFVGFSEEQMAAVADPKRRIIAHHNHPSSNSFSPQDIKMLQHHKGFEGIWAHGHNGSSFYAERGPNASTFNSARSLDQAEADARKQIFDRLYAAGKMTAADINTVYWHGMMLVMQKRGFVAYHYELAGPAAEVWSKYSKEIMDHVERIR